MRWTCLIVIAAICPAALSLGQTGSPFAGTVLYALTPPPVSYGVVTGNHASSAGGGEVVGSISFATSLLIHAALWQPDGTPVDLNYATGASQLYGTNGVQQVGWSGGYNVNQNAALWSGTPASYVDLDPANGESIAYATDGTQQVGYANSGLYGTGHPILWTGTAASQVDLFPATAYNGSSTGEAVGVGGGKQVGDVTIYNPTTFAQADHAFLWSGNAASAIDLSPTLPTLLPGGNSAAAGTTATQQVGYAAGLDGTKHAILWSGTAASAVDLNPTLLPNIDNTDAVSTNNIEQVGNGTDTSLPNDPEVAMLWFGTAASAVDLQSLLPAGGSWTDSYATDVDASGNIFGIADGTYNGVTGTFAVEWSAVPEPSSVMIVALAIPALIRRRTCR